MILDLAMIFDVWHQKHIQQKNQLNFREITNFCVSKDTWRESKGKLQNAKKYLQIMYLTRG